MIQIDDQVISLEVLREEFVCNLGACKGACCVEGDSGAPLENKELKILAKEFPNIRPYLRKEGIDAIERQGTSVKDSDDEWVTPLRDGKECAYTIFDEKGTAMCGIETAWKDGKTTFRKPISCHLYPIRTKRYPTFEAVNYSRWNICSDACTLGKELKVPVYKFLKEALIRKYGGAWYDALEKVAAELDKMDENDEITK
jgi:hypothetical protein